MSTEQESKIPSNALAEWFDSFVGSEEERVIADAVLAEMKATSLLARAMTKEDAISLGLLKTWEKARQGITNTAQTLSQTDVDG